MGASVPSPAWKGWEDRAVARNNVALSSGWWTLEAALSWAQSLIQGVGSLKAVWA